MIMISNFDITRAEWILANVAFVGLGEFKVIFISHFYFDFIIKKFSYLHYLTEDSV